MTKPRQPAPDTFSADYIPPHAITCWVDDTHVYTAIPALVGPPLIQRYALTEGGLSKALSILRVQRKEALRRGGIEPARKGAPAVRKADPVKGTPEQREAALAILKKMGIL